MALALENHPLDHHYNTSPVFEAAPVIKCSSKVSDDSSSSLSTSNDSSTGFRKFPIYIHAV